MNRNRVFQVVIVGRTNVGKSTLFNRLVGRRDAIVKDLPGVTRKSGLWDLGTAQVEVVDTGGLDGLMGQAMGAATVQQARRALEQADVILFVVDAHQGLTPQDHEAARAIRRSGRPCILVVNKVDHPSHEVHAEEFHALGFEPLVMVSAEHGLGMADLEDCLLEQLPEGYGAEPEESEMKLAILGRPNVGKSSLVNALLGSERVIVSDVPGTTRDSIDTPLTYQGRALTIIDTAGIRRAGRIDRELEQFCVLMARRALRRCDVAAVIVDGSEGLTDGDARIAGEVIEAGRGCMIVINKWDLVTAAGTDTKAFLRRVRAQLPHADFAPMITVSALTGKRVDRVIDTALTVFAECSKRVPTPALNRALGAAFERHQPPRLPNGRPFRFYYAVQVRTRPPGFRLFTNTSVPPQTSYQRYLKNCLRESFGFEGAPLRLWFRLRPRSRKRKQQGRS
jgi:GTP-binding protein